MNKYESIEKCAEIFPKGFYFSGYYVDGKVTIISTNAIEPVNQNEVRTEEIDAR